MRPLPLPLPGPGRSPLPRFEPEPVCMLVVSSALAMEVAASANVVAALNRPIERKLLIFISHDQCERCA